MVGLTELSYGLVKNLSSRFSAKLSVSLRIGWLALLFRPARAHFQHVRSPAVMIDHF